MKLLVVDVVKISDSERGLAFILCISKSLGKRAWIAAASPISVKVQDDLLVLVDQRVRVFEL